MVGCKWELVVPPRNLQVLAQAVSCLHKIGKELLIDASKNDMNQTVLNFRTLNDGKSAFCCFRFEEAFFDQVKHEAPQEDVVQAAAVPLPALAKLLRSALGATGKGKGGGVTRNTTKLRIALEEGSGGAAGCTSFVCFTWEGSAGERRRHRFLFNEQEVMAAIFDAGSSSSLAAQPLQLNGLLEHLKTPDVSVLVSKSTLKVRSYHNPVPVQTAANGGSNGGAGTQPLPATGSGLSTEMAVATRDFDAFNFLAPLEDFENGDGSGSGGGGGQCQGADLEVELVFGLREIKALIAFCMSTEAHVLNLHFIDNGLPLQATSEHGGSGFSAELFLSTMQTDETAPNRIAEREERAEQQRSQQEQSQQEQSQQEQSQQGHQQGGQQQQQQQQQQQGGERGLGYDQGQSQQEEGHGLYDDRRHDPHEQPPSNLPDFAHGNSLSEVSAREGAYQDEDEEHNNLQLASQWSEQGDGDASQVQRSSTSVGEVSNYKAGNDDLAEDAFSGSGGGGGSRSAERHGNSDRESKGDTHRRRKEEEQEEGGEKEGEEGRGGHEQHFDAMTAPYSTEKMEPLQGHRHDDADGQQRHEKERFEAHGSNGGGGGGDGGCDSDRGCAAAGDGGFSMDPFGDNGDGGGNHRSHTKKNRRHHDRHKEQQQQQHKHQQQEQQQQQQHQEQRQEQQQAPHSPFNASRQGTGDQQHYDPSASFADAKEEEEPIAAGSIDDDARRDHEEAHGGGGRSQPPSQAAEQEVYAEQSQVVPDSVDPTQREGEGSGVEVALEVEGGLGEKERGEEEEEEDVILVGESPSLEEVEERGEERGDLASPSPFSLADEPSSLASSADYRLPSARRRNKHRAPGAPLLQESVHDTDDAADLNHLEEGNSDDADNRHQQEHQQDDGGSNNNGGGGGGGGVSGEDEVPAEEIRDQRASVGSDFSSRPSRGAGRSSILSSDGGSSSAVEETPQKKQSCPPTPSPMSAAGVKATPRQEQTQVVPDSLAASGGGWGGGGGGEAPPSSSSSSSSATPATAGGRRNQRRQNLRDLAESHEVGAANEGAEKDGGGGEDGSATGGTVLRSARKRSASPAPPPAVSSKRTPSSRRR